MKIALRLVAVSIFISMLCFTTACKKERAGLSIAVSPSAPVAHEDVQFTASQSGANWNYSWEFGDGSVATTTSTSVKHDYLQPGTYNVSLSIDDNGAAEGNVSVSIIVH